MPLRWIGRVLAVIVALAAFAASVAIASPATEVPVEPKKSTETGAKPTGPRVAPLPKLEPRDPALQPAPKASASAPPPVAPSAGKPTGPAPLRTPVSLIRVEPSPAPPGAVVRVIAKSSVDLDAIDEKGGFLRVGSRDIRFIRTKDSEATFQVPTWDELGAPKPPRVEVTLIAKDNESLPVSLELISPEATVIPPGAEWKLRDVTPIEKDPYGKTTVVRFELDRELPVAYWGKVRILFGGVEGQVVELHPGAIDVRVPSGAAPENFALTVGDRKVVKSESPAASDDSARRLRAQAEELAQLKEALAKGRAGEKWGAADIAVVGGGASFLIFLAWLALRRSRLAARELDEARLETAQVLARLQKATVQPDGQALDQETGESSTVTAISFTPDVPSELVTACASSGLVIFVGHDLAVQAGLPTLAELLSDLAAKYADDLQGVDPSWLKTAKGSDPRLADVIRRGLNADELISALQLRLRPRSSELPRAYQRLAALPVSGIVTTGWDNLLETALRAREPIVTTPRDGEGVAEALRSSRPFLFRLHGDLARPETFGFTTADLESALYENETAQKALASLLLSKTFLFVGESVAGIEAFMSVLRLRSQGSTLHYALVPRNADVALDASRFRSRYGIELLPFGATKGQPEVSRFLENLADAVKSAGAVRASETSSLERISLENIGPFEKLELSFRKNWNVLLGNNGCGKSTLLRALAVGLCGADAKDWKGAGGLLRTGCSTGAIEIGVGTTTYRTELVRTGDKVDVRSTTFTPLQAKQWVAVGFPPLRGASVRDSTGPGPSGSRHPQVEDLKPLVIGSADSRMDDLKQWIINLSVAAESSDASEASSARKTREKVFELLAALTPGVEVGFSRLDRRTWQVWVKTNDGEVPFGLVSQGTHSVFGWVGTLLLRMYETAAAGSEPEKSAAIVLVDEIDAHMHPEWQQKLVPVVRKLFPNLQVIATTHSPLIVSSTEKEEVVRFVRNDADRLVVEPLDSEIRNYRADQILTSPAFSLTSTRSGTAEDMVARYAKLLGKANRTAAEEKEVVELREKLRDVLSPKESPLQRQVERAVEATMSRLAENPDLSSKPELEPAVEAEVRRQLRGVLESTKEPS